MKFPTGLVTLAILISVALAGCATLARKGTVPASGGSFPSLGQFAELDEPLYFSFSLDHDIPFNPVEVPAKDMGWHFSVTLRSTTEGMILDVENRSRASIPLRLLGVTREFETELTIKPNTKTQIPLRGCQRHLLFFIEIYDERAIVSKRVLGSTQTR